MSKQLWAAGLRGYRRDTPFIPGRRYRADFYWPRLKLCLEVDGGVWLGKRGGHTSGKGYSSDRERDVEALRHGILTVRYTSKQVRNGYAIDTFQEIFRDREKEMNETQDA